MFFPVKSLNNSDVFEYTNENVMVVVFFLHFSITCEGASCTEINGRYQRYRWFVACCSQPMRFTNIDWHNPVMDK